MQWQIWMEGFHTQGSDKVGAFLEATVEANTFKEACDKHYFGNALYNPDNLTLWGCRLFDNEAEARRSFG